MVAQYRVRRPAESDTKAFHLWQWLLRPTPQLLLRYAAAICLVSAITFSAYRIGTTKGQGLIAARDQSSAAGLNVLRGQLNQLTQERAGLDEHLKARSADLQTVSQQLQHQITEVEKWKALQSKTSEDLQKQTSSIVGLQSQYSSVVTERDTVNRKLQES